MSQRSVACVAHVGSAGWQGLPAALEELRPRLGRVPVYPVSEPGEARELVGDLAAGLDTLVVFGGDGTIHEVVNGLSLGARDPDVLLLPGGTGNDLVRGLGLPTDAAEAARALAAAVPRPLDLLECAWGQEAAAQGHPARTLRAANGVNAGFAAAATESLSQGTKRRLGPIAYLLGGLRAAVPPRIPSWQARVEVGDAAFEGPVLAVVVGNGPSFGGGLPLLEGADPGDGLLDVLVVPAGASKSRIAGGLARNRLPEDLPRFRGPWARLATDMPCRLDGEAHHTPSSVSVRPRAWRVLVSPAAPGG